MAELQSRCEELDSSLTSELREMLRNIEPTDGPTKKYLLKPTVITDGELLRKEIIGQKNEDKPRKVILMVGETGTGKSTLINAMINYIMGVRWEHGIWLEVTEILEDQTTSQTKAVTVYEVYAQNSPFSLTVIDTPGFGDTDGFDKDRRIAEALQQLFRSEDGIHEIHAVCLVLKATDARLHDRKRYILDEILSLFGKDIEKHILLLFTHQEKKNLPKRIFNFITESLSKYTKNGEYTCFKFDNCQSECSDEEDRESYKASWDNGIEHFRQFFDYVNGINPKSLDMTEGVLRARKQLDACVGNLRERIELTDLKKQEIEQTKTALGEFKNYKKEKNNFEYEVDEPYKVEVPINASFWHFLSKQATRCTFCEENCHYPGCWWVSDLSRCSVMKEGKCTVCTGRCTVCEGKCDGMGKCTVFTGRCTVCEGKCDHTGKCTVCTGMSIVCEGMLDSTGRCKVCKGRCDHIKKEDNKEKCDHSVHKKDYMKYETKTRKVKKTNNDLKKKYDEDFGEKENLMTKLENESRQIEAEKIRLVEECYQCLEKLLETALKSTSISSYVHLDFMIEKVKETGNQERAQKLEELKMRALEENKGLVERLCNFSIIK